MFICGFHPHSKLWGFCHLSVKPKPLASSVLVHKTELKVILSSSAISILVLLIVPVNTALYRYSSLEMHASQ